MRFPIDLGGSVLDEVLGAAPILPAKMILGKAFTDNSIKSIEPERRRIVPNIGRPVPVLTLFTYGTIAHVDVQR